MARIRSKRGAVIAEGVVGLLMIITMTLVAGFLLLNTAQASCNKEKLGFVSNRAATYAATLPNDSSRPGLVKTMVDKTLDDLSFHSAGNTVVVTDLSIASRPAVKVKITASLPALMSGGLAASIFPQQVNLQDTAVAVKQVKFWGYGVGVLPNLQKYTAPIVNATGALPNDGLPAYGLSITNLWKMR